MTLTDQEVQKQIRQMTAFIDQEANEKVEEIDAKAEEEFQIEKSRLVQDQRVKIMEYYAKKEKQIELSKKIQNSNLMNQARLKILASRQQHMGVIQDEARKRLGEVTKDHARYKSTLHGLILQSLYQLLEKEVIIYCRQQDHQLVNEAIRSAIEEYKKTTCKDIKVNVDQKNFLGNHISGGVEVSSMNGKIRCVNTLESRLEQMFQQMVPEIREIVFGKNMNRKFRD